MNTINWNQMSDLGLIEKINREILHPLGLAISRNPETGHSENVFVAADGVFEYGDIKSTILSETELLKRVEKLR